MKSNYIKQIPCPFKGGQLVWLVGNALRTREVVIFIKPTHVPVPNQAHIQLTNGEYHCVPLAELSLWEGAQQEEV